MPSTSHRLRLPAANYRFEVEAYLRLGRLLQGEEHAEEAISVLKQGLTIDPDAPDLYNVLGGVYSILGRHDEAARMHQRYVELVPDEPNAHDSLGMSYQWAGLATYVGQGGEARNSLCRKMRARGQEFRHTPIAERGRIAT